MKDRVLVVDDEPDVCQLLSYNLGEAGFEVESAHSATEALLTAARNKPAVMVLDVGLPDMSGYELCRQIRRDDSLGGVGVLMLTALGADEDRISGLEAGADDYVVKPFNVQEVVLRVNALVRRIAESKEARGKTPGAPLRCGELVLDPATHDVRAGDRPLELRPLEYKLLSTLMAEPGRVFSREELLRNVWELERGGSPRTVDAHVRRLRKNLHDHADVVETVPGFGYRARADG
ncbi:MAG: response regulator [Myxococcota bacterium]